MAPGITRETLRAGKEPRARYRLRMHGDFQSTWESRNHIGALTDILEVRLREVLREEKGGVYGVGVSYGTWDTPFQAAQVSVDFTCDPERVEELRGEVFRIIQEMREKPLEARYTESEQEINRRERELSKVTNGFWLSSIEGALSRGEDPSEILTWDERNDAITPETMLKMAQAVLRVDQYVELVMLPE
jgi:zinc protease